MGGSIRAVRDTALEARLVGDVGTAVAPANSRFALFDAFVRKRLGKAASDGVRVLSLVAGWLFERLAFSLSIREFDRLMDAGSVSTELRGLVIDKRLLTLRGDRVSFPHEMFLDVFAAEAVVRQAKGRAEPVIQALAAPLHGARKDLIIGAIDDDSMLELLLPGLEDPVSIRSCLEGRCGSYAQNWAQDHGRRLWVQLRDEVCNVRFRVDRDGLGNVELDESRLVPWSRCDQAFLGVLAERIAEGQYLEDVLEAVGILDQRIADESVRLSQETATGVARLRNEMFELSYVHPRLSFRSPGISIVCANLGRGVSLVRSRRIGRSNTSQATNIFRDLVEREFSPGQNHLLLILCRWDGIPASFLSRTIETHWDRAPYHLRLALMYSAALYCDVEDDAERERLVMLLEGLLPQCNAWFASSVVDALQRLGAFDDAAREFQSVVRENIRKCLAEPTDNDRQAEAWAIYSSQFDDPYSDAYCEVLADLADNERKQLLKMASRGMKETGLFLAPLLLELASFGDPGLAANIGRWTSPPPADNRTMPQNDIEVFLVAHIALARLGCPLPDHRTTGEEPTVKALNACGAILYWSNRQDLHHEDTLKACEREFEVLAQGGRSAALDVLRACEDVLREGWESLPGDGPVVQSIVARFPAEAAAISRDALRDPLSQVGYFRVWSRFDRQRILAFGVRVLGRCGNGSDRSILRQYASSQEHGSSAIAALKAIEDRLRRESDRHDG